MTFEKIEIPPPSQPEPQNKSKQFIIAAVALLICGTAWSLRGSLLSSIGENTLDPTVETTHKYKGKNTEETVDPWADIDNLPPEEIKIARRKYDEDEKKNQKISQTSDGSTTSQDESPNVDEGKNEQGENSTQNTTTSTKAQPSTKEQAKIDKKWVTETYNGACSIETSPKKCTKLRIKFRCEDRFDDSTENRKRTVKECKNTHDDYLKEISKTK